MVVEVFGKRGSGKTVFIGGQLKFCRGPVVILDLLGNFQAEKMKELKIECNFLDHEGDAIDLMADYAQSKDPKKKYISLKTSDPSLSIDYMSSALWHCGGGTLVVDEVDGFSTTEAPCFDEVIRYGRNKGIDLITGCRRPAEISRNITAAANKIFIFQTQEPRDVEYFEKTILGSKAENLMSLPEYHGIFINYDKRKTGEFKTDKFGNVFILSEENFNQIVSKQESDD